LVNGFLAVFTIVAVCMDLKSQKIDNLWIMIGWSAGLLYQIFSHRFRGVGVFLLGSLLPIFLLYLLFWFRMLGAGDIKMLSVLGGVMGAGSILICMGWSLLFGALFSVAAMIVCGNFFSRFRYFIDYLRDFLKTKQVVPYMVRGNRMENIHFSVPILLGVLLYIGGVY